MSLARYLQKLRFIDHLICRKATGTQKALASKVGVSASTLNEYLGEMRDMGFPIRYCHKRRTYFYEKEGRMVDSLFSEDTTREELKKATGGWSNSFTQKNHPIFQESTLFQQNNF